MRSGILSLRITEDLESCRGRFAVLGSDDASDPTMQDRRRKFSAGMVDHDAERRAKSSTSLRGTVVNIFVSR